MLPRFGPDAGGWADQPGRKSPIGQHRGQSVLAVERPHHDGGKLSRVDVDRIGGRGDGDEPCADPQCGACAQSRGAGCMPGTGNGDGMPTIVFVHLLAQAWEVGLPELGPIGEQRRGDVVQHLLGNADVGENGHAATAAARHQQVAGLQPEERNSTVGTRHIAVQCASGAVDAARHIDRESAGLGRDAARQHLLDRWVEAAIEPGAEQGVDHHAIGSGGGGVERGDRPAPERRHPGGVTAQPIAGDEAGDRHIEAALPQQSRGGKTVAAIVAGTA